MGAPPFVAPWVGRCHSDLDASDADGDERADLEQLEPDGPATGICELGSDEADPTQGGQQDISH